MKTRRLFPIILIILIGTQVSANFVSLKEAQTVAHNFYFEKFNQYEGKLELNGIQIKSTYTSKSDTENYYYVFQFETGGFVIVPADKRLRPVLGYSLKSDFGTENQPPNLEYWFGQFEDQVRYVRQNNVKVVGNLTEQWSHYLSNDFAPNVTNNSKSLEPLLTTTWAQDWPYNYYCPEASTGGSAGRTYLGCVATAQAQMYYYYRWSDHGQGYTSYISSVYPETGFQYADFENTWYRYNEMVDQPQTVNLAIAEYSYHIAVSLHMNFSGVGSFAGYTDSSEYFLKMHPSDFYFKDDMPIEQWLEMMYSALDNKRPILYGGFPQGHAFVCDGYQDNDYFHFNMGWGGTSNGYYALDDLLGFNDLQFMYPDFFPDTVNFNYPLFQTGADTLRTFEGSICDGSGPIFDYQSNAQISWLIDPQTEIDSVSNITIMMKRLDIADDGDKLLIYDGGDNTAPLLAELSGNVIPDDIVSTSNKVFVEFISNDFENAPGFYLNYECEQPDWCNEVTQITSSSSIINDGSGEFYYYNNTTCFWMIDPGINSPLTIEFNYFKTEETYDILKIIDTETNTLITEISGEYETPPPPVTSPSGKLALVFNTNSENRNIGWEIYYDINNTGYTKNIMAERIELYPNPARGMVNLSAGFKHIERLKITLYNCLGKKVYTHKTLFYPGETNSFDISIIKEGIYTAIIEIQDSKTIKKLIIF